jgi:hypothetical protein
MCLTTTIGGEFSTMWLRRARDLVIADSERDVKLQRLERRLDRLTLSHERLELGAQGSLRAALEHLDRLAPSGLADRAGGLMQILSGLGWLHRAGLYRVDDDRRVDPTALASLGPAWAPRPEDPVVAAALRSRAPASVQDDLEDHGEGAVAAVPVRGADERVVGVLAIHEMGFANLTGRNLRLLAALVSHA